MVSFNQRFLQLWGIPESIAESRDDDQALAYVLGQLKEPQQFLTKVRELYANAEAESSDVLDFKDGRVFERYSHPQRVGTEVVGRVWSFRDVTERRDAEEARARSARAEDILARQARDLERSNAALEQFACVASHDLQEPLRMVSSYLQLLQRRYEGQLDADADEFIGFAVDGATRMKALINDLLNLSRITTHGKTFEPTDMDAVLGRALANLRATIQEAGAEVTHVQLPILICDAKQLEQLFQNLISNAIKFRSDKTPRVHVGAEHKDGEWAFSVRDNGIGIDPEYAQRIFVIFQRLHARDEYAGTGMGLAICKKIVERRGGRIWVESRLGEGSTLYFTIPQRGDGQS